LKAFPDENGLIQLNAKTNNIQVARKELQNE
jgi:hypothetical protein